MIVRSDVLRAYLFFFRLDVSVFGVVNLPLALEISREFIFLPLSLFRHMIIGNFADTSFLSFACQFYLPSPPIL